MARVMKGISLIIPAHNEGEVIYKMAAEAVHVLEKLSLEYEIINKQIRARPEVGNSFWRKNIRVFQVVRNHTRETDNKAGVKA